jgi:hypothetical protein
MPQILETFTRKKIKPSSPAKLQHCRLLDVVVFVGGVGGGSFDSLRGWGVA